VEEAPTEDAPVEDAPVEDAPVEDAPVEDAPVEESVPVLEQVASDIREILSTSVEETTGSNPQENVQQHERERYR
jgi:hypothetical protein